jgi:hypothetical protein
MGTELTTDFSEDTDGAGGRKIGGRKMGAAAGGKRCLQKATKRRERRGKARMTRTALVGAWSAGARLEANRAVERLSKSTP